MTIELNGSLLLLGAGKMGSALLSGWLSGGLEREKIQIVDPKPLPNIKNLISTYELAHNPEPSPVDVIVLAVKPQILDQVLQQAKDFITQESLIISIAAGRRLSSIEALLPSNCSVIRTMPNTPAEIGMGITVACANGHVSEEQKNLCHQLLQSVGEVDWIEDEDLMDAVTAVSGSGPAYVFYFMECLAKAGMESGLDEQIANRLARATISGAGALLHQTDLSASVLRENVTSPGGTTQAALDVLMSDSALEAILKKAVSAAKKRSQELSS